MMKSRKPKKPWKKRLLHGLRRKRVPTPPTDYSDALYKSTTEESDVDSRELKVTF